MNIKEKIQNYLKNNYPIEDISDKLPQLINYMNADKKNINDNYNFVLLDSVGKARYGQLKTREQVIKELGTKN